MKSAIAAPALGHGRRPVTRLWPVRVLSVARAVAPQNNALRGHLCCRAGVWGSAAVGGSQRLPGLRGRDQAFSAVAARMREARSTVSCASTAVAEQKSAARPVPRGLFSLVGLYASQNKRLGRARVAQALPRVEISDSLSHASAIPSTVTIQDNGTPSSTRKIQH